VPTGGGGGGGGRLARTLRPRVLRALPAQWGLDGVPYGSADSVLQVVAGSPQSAKWLQVEPFCAGSLLAQVRAWLQRTPPSARISLRYHCVSIRGLQAYFFSRVFARTFFGYTPERLIFAAHKDVRYPVIWPIRRYASGEFNPVFSDTR